MFKFETLVKWVVCSLVLVSFSVIAADRDDDDDRRSRKSEVKERLEGAKAYKAECGTPDLRKKNGEEYCNMIKSVIYDGRDVGGCDSAKKDYMAAEGEFRSSCLGGIPTSGPAGNIACGYAIERCKCSGMSTSDPQYAKLNCNEAPTEVGGSTPIGHYDIPAAKRLFKFCPDYAAADLKELEKEFREAKKDLRELEKKRPELLRKIQQAKEQGLEKMNQAKKAMAEAAKQRREKITEAKRQHRQAQNQLMDRLAQLQEELLKNDEGRTEVALSRHEAKIVRDQDITAVRMNCHATATAQVTKLQAERLELERNRSYNRGGFTAMLKEIGVSDREAWQKVAKKYYDWCLQSTPTRESIKAANQKYKQTLKRADESERKIDNRRKEILAQMNRIKNNQACNTAASGTSPTGESAETELCQAFREAMETGKQAEADYQIDVENARGEYIAGMNSAAASEAISQQELQMLTNEIAEEKARLDNLREYLALKKQNAPGGSMEGKDVQEARVKHGLMVGKAKALFACNTRDECSADGVCRQAWNYVEKVIGHEVSFKNETSSDVRPASRGGSDGTGGDSSPPTMPRYPRNHSGGGMK